MCAYEHRTYFDFFFFRIEMYCRELTERFEDVWIVSGPLTLPHTGSDGKKAVSYQVRTCYVAHELILSFSALLLNFIYSALLIGNLLGL